MAPDRQQSLNVPHDPQFQHPIDEPDSLLGVSRDSLDHDTSTEPSSDSNDLEQLQTSISLLDLFTEVSALVAAVGCLVSFVILLKQYDQKPTPQWSLGPWGITLNTVISFMSLVFRSCILIPVTQCISQFCWVWYTRQRSLDDVCYYDAASRGPLGSIRLLFRLRFMSVKSLVIS